MDRWAIAEAPHVGGGGRRGEALTRVSIDGTVGSRLLGEEDEWVWFETLAASGLCFDAGRVRPEVVMEPFSDHAASVVCF